MPEIARLNTDSEKFEIENLETRFQSHTPKTGEYTSLRKLGLFVSQELLKIVPDCRERSVAITRIEEGIMWAQLGIDRHQIIEEKEVASETTEL